MNLYLRLLQVYSPGHLEICRQTVSTAPNTFQGSYSPTPEQEKISFMDFIFLHLATIIYQSSKGRGELNVFPLLLLLQAERCGWGCFSPFMYLRVYILPSTQQSFSMFYSSISLHLSFLFFLNWAFFSPVFSFFPPTRPWSYYHISLPHELYSQAERKSNDTGGENSCFLHDYTLAPLVTSAAFRIIAQVANYLTEGSARTKWSWYYLLITAKA